MKIGDIVTVIDDDLYGVILSIRGEIIDFKDQYGFVQSFPKSQMILRKDDLYHTAPISKDVDLPKFPKKVKKTKEYTLDLHIDKLSYKHKTLSATERLLIQKEALLSALDYCRQNRIKILTIIHGIGEGVLQKMVYDCIEGQTGIEYEDGDFFYDSVGFVKIYFK